MSASVQRGRSRQGSSCRVRKDAAESLPGAGARRQPGLGSPLEGPWAVGPGPQAWLQEGQGQGLGRGTVSGSGLPPPGRKRVAGTHLRERLPPGPHPSSLMFLYLQVTKQPAAPSTEQPVGPGPRHSRARRAEAAAFRRPFARPIQPGRCLSALTRRVGTGPTLGAHTRTE